MPELVYLNDWTGSFEDAFVSVNDRGYNFGDGVYEVVRAYNGKMFALEDHLKRLESSAAAVDIELPRDVGQLKAICEEVLAKSRIKEAMVYIQVTRGTAPRNHLFDPGLKPNLLITVRNIPGMPSPAFDEGVKVISLPDLRWQMCNVKTISLQANILARHRARQAGAVEAVFVLPDGTVTECSASNIFMYGNGVLRTHPADNKILAGVTRQYVLQLAESLGVEVRVEPFTLSVLQEAEEVFITGTVAEIVPVVVVDGKTVGSGRPGPVTALLQKSFSSLV